MWSGIGGGVLYAVAVHAVLCRAKSRRALEENSAGSRHDGHAKVLSCEFSWEGGSNCSQVQAPETRRARRERETESEREREKTTARHEVALAQQL